MIKNRIANILVFIIVLFAIWFSHSITLKQNHQFTEIIKLAYLFLGSFTVLLCVGFLTTVGLKKFQKQLGFVYLFSVPVKIILFSVVFKDLFLDPQFNFRNLAVNLLIPIVLTLAFEVFFLSKLLNNFSSVKNEK